MGLAALALAASVVAPAGPVAAEGLTFSTSGPVRNRMADFAAKTAVLDSRAAKQYANSVRLTPAYKKSKQAGVVIPSYSGNYRGAYLELARAAARKHGIPEDLFLRLVQRESGWNAQAVSHKGAQGLAQLMPDTASLLRVDPADPAQNLEGGARYLKMMFDKFGDWKLALAAYNAGPLAVEAHDGIPPYEETKNYVAAILGG